MIDLTDSAGGDPPPERLDWQTVRTLGECIGRYRLALSALRSAEEDNDQGREQLARDALLYRLTLLAETVKALPASVRSAETAIPWQRLLQLRADVTALPRISSQNVRAICNEALAELEYELPALRQRALARR